MGWNFAVRCAHQTISAQAVDGPGPDAASLEFLNAQGTVLAHIALNRPAFTQSGDLLTLANVPREALASAGGIAAFSRFKNSREEIIYDGLTVGVANADYIVNSVQFRSGQIIRVASITLKHAA